MKHWEHIPLHHERPQTDGYFSNQERALLEFIVCSQLADILSDYGHIEEVGLDVGKTNSADVKSYFGLAIPKIPLQHNGNLILGQFPWRNGDNEESGEYGTQEGLYALSVHNQQNVPTLEAALWDPSIETDHRIYDAQGNALTRPVLHEIYDALTVVSHELALRDTVSTISSRARNFPIAIIEPSVEITIIDYFQN